MVFAAAPQPQARARTAAPAGGGPGLHRRHRAVPSGATADADRLRTMNRLRGLGFSTSAMARPAPLFSVLRRQDAGSYGQVLRWWVPAANHGVSGRHGRSWPPGWPPGQQLGTTTLLRREKTLLADGRIDYVPVISGNTFRGWLRRVGEDGQLSLTAAHALRGGGALAKTSGPALAGQRLATLRSLIGRRDRAHRARASAEPLHPFAFRPAAG